jgi:hypothetical protein
MSREKSVYELLCEMFPKRDVDYAIRKATHPRPPNKPHKQGCKLDRDHIGKCWAGR